MGCFFFWLVRGKLRFQALFLGRKRKCPSPVTECRHGSEQGTGECRGCSVSTWNSALRVVLESSRMMFILARLTVNQQVGIHEDADTLHSGGGVVLRSRDGIDLRRGFSTCDPSNMRKQQQQEAKMRTSENLAFWPFNVCMWRGRAPQKSQGGLTGPAKAWERGQKPTAFCCSIFQLRSFHLRPER